MRKYFGIILSIIIFIFTAFLIFLPKKNFSEDENRMLETFPDITISNIISGNFMTSMEEYIKDHFAFRKFFLDLKARTELVIGKNENNGVYICDDDYLIKKTSAPNYSYYDKIVEVFLMFEKKEEVKNVNISLMIAPTSITINNKLLPKNAEPFDELEKIKYLYEKLNNLGTNISLIDVADKLRNEENKENPLYFRLDHHWTSYGAYCAYESYLSSLSMQPLKLDAFNKKTVTTGFNGTIYSESNIYFLPSDNIVAFENKKNSFEVFYPSTNKLKYTLFDADKLNGKGKYSYFLGGDFDIIQIKNTMSKSKNNLLIIKDSYANSFIPFIANDFKNTHVIDLRHFKKDTVSNYAKIHNISHILFLYNIRTIENADIIKLK